MDGRGTTYFDANEIVDLLEYFEDRNDLEHYEKILSVGFKLHPENTDFKYHACKLLVLREHYDEALTQITQTGYEHEEGWDLLKIECLCALDRYDSVKSIIEHKHAQQDERLEELYEYTVAVLSDLDKRDELNELISAGLSLFPDNPILKEEYCYLLELQGYCMKAIFICNELIDADPYFADYWYMAGRLYAKSGNYEKAAESLDFAVTCNNADVEIKIFRAFCLYKKGAVAQSIKIFHEAYTAGTQDGEDIRELIRDIAAEYPVPEDFEEACEMFESLCRNSNEFPAFRIDQLAHLLFGDDNKSAIGAHLFNRLSKDSEATDPDDKDEDDESVDDILRFLSRNALYSEKIKRVSSEQLAVQFLTKKFHNN